MGNALSVDATENDADPTSFENLGSRLELVQESVGQPVENIFDDGEIKLSQEEYDNVRYHGVLVSEMSYRDLKSSIKKEGCKNEFHQTKKHSRDMLVSIESKQKRNGIAHDVDQNIVIESIPSIGEKSPSIGCL